MMDQIHVTKLPSYTEGFVDLYLRTNLVLRLSKKRKVKETYTSPSCTSVEEHCDLSEMITRINLVTNLTPKCAFKSHAFLCNVFFFSPLIKRGVKSH